MGRPSAQARSAASTPSKIARRTSSPATPTGAAAASGSESAGWAQASSRNTSAKRAWGAPGCVPPMPHRTATPWVCASRAPSTASRVLPTPRSPRRTIAPDPCSTSASRTRSSGPRPRTGVGSVVPRSRRAARRAPSRVGRVRGSPTSPRWIAPRSARVSSDGPSPVSRSASSQASYWRSASARRPLAARRRMRRRRASSDAGSTSTSRRRSGIASWASPSAPAARASGKAASTKRARSA